MMVLQRRCRGEEKVRGAANVGGGGSPDSPNGNRHFGHSRASITGQFRAYLGIIGYFEIDSSFYVTLLYSPCSIDSGFGFMLLYVQNPTESADIDHRSSNRSRDKIHLRVTKYPNGHLQVFCPLVTLGNPLFQLLGIAGSEPNLERLGLCGQGRRDSIALNGIQNWPVTLFLGGFHVESCDQPQESRVELAVRKMRASTHTGAGPISVVRSPRPFAQLKISLRDEFVGFLEMVLIIVGGPGILVRVS